MGKLTLESEIQYCQDKAKINREIEHLDDIQYDYCQDKADHYEQLVIWLNKVKDIERVKKYIYDYLESDIFWDDSKTDIKDRICNILKEVSYDN